jgi:hypothetical protein
MTAAVPRLWWTIFGVADWPDLARPGADCHANSVNDRPLSPPSSTPIARTDVSYRASINYSVSLVRVLAQM